MLPQSCPAYSRWVKGQVSVFLRSNTVAGQYYVTATAGSKSAVAPVTFEALAADAGHSYLLVAPTSIIADGSSTATIPLTAKDQYDNPVALR